MSDYRKVEIVINIIGVDYNPMTREDRDKMVSFKKVITVGDGLTLEDIARKFIDATEKIEKGINMNINLIIKKDDFNQEEFSFWFDDRTATLVLDVYRIVTRKSNRHKFETVKQYSRLENQRSSKWLDLKGVPLTDEIKKLALERFTSQIKVDVWKGRF